MWFIAERLSARQLILRRISEIVCMYVFMYVCMYPSRLGIQLFRALSVTCASVTLRNVTAAPAIAVHEESGDEVFLLQL